MAAVKGGAEMFVMNASGTKIFNLYHVIVINLAETLDATVVMVSLASGEVKSLERYANPKEAQEAVASLFAAIAEGKNHFIMPDSVLKYGEKIVKDARVARRGGS